MTVKVLKIIKTAVIVKTEIVILIIIKITIIIILERMIITIVKISTLILETTIMVIFMNYKSSNMGWTKSLASTIKVVRYIRTRKLQNAKLEALNRNIEEIHRIKILEYITFYMDQYPSNE